MLKNNQAISVYLFVFLILSLILKFFNIIDVSTAELIGYALIFYGINLVYTSFGRQKPGKLFIGSTLFLAGLLLFLINNFEFTNIKEIIFPSILFVLGINFLMIFLDDNSRKNFLAISVTSILSALIVTALLGTMTINSFFRSALLITIKYWPIIIVAAGLILLLNIESRKKP